MPGTSEHKIEQTIPIIYRLLIGANGSESAMTRSIWRIMSAIVLTFCIVSKEET